MIRSNYVKIRCRPLITVIITIITKLSKCQDSRNYSDIGSNWVICRDMDGPRVCHTERSKLESEQMLYINAYMWNLEK